MTAASLILPANALHDVRVGISVSESPDLARLGLTEGHFRLALGEIARTVLILGGKLAYGGHLNPSGYTVFLVSELRRYARRDRPLMVCLAWSEHRRMRLTELEAAATELGLYGSIVCLNLDGEPIPPEVGRNDDAAPEDDTALVAHGLTSLRHFMTRKTGGRVLIGGKRAGFQGAMPGLVEEATIALEAKRPLFLAGGFGGVTQDMIRAIEPHFSEWVPQFTPAPTVDVRCQRSLEALAVLTAGKGWTCFNNGLARDECQRLAATHRPSEIATLVSLGLGRLAQASS